MNVDRWQKIKEVFNQAVELSAGERESFVAVACRDDGEMRAEIEKMLSFADDDSLLEKNAFDILTDETGASIPEKIGKYKIISEIGRGGMGVVFLATRDDGEYQQKVAIKLIKRGMDSDDILRRFRTERQILAELQHPNIARLLDGGVTEDGLPFYAMEFIEGVPVDVYCKDKSLTEKLGIFRQVCSAVSYAHGQLVVHRDLKPSNILVTTDGTPKLLDFGIAKVLSPDLSNNAGTATQLGMMTPAYASPEQIRGEKVATTSDVYSLGVILYELLAGEKPYQTEGKSYAEVIDVICNSEPKRPSTLATHPYSEDNSTIESANYSTKRRAEKTSLKGDLDNIVLKALQKTSTRRYLSVEQFSEDIRRHLVGLPVMARRDTISYRFSKFVERNRAAVFASALVILALVAGTTVATWQAVRAERERQLAQKRFDQSRNVANALVFKYHDAIANLPDASPVREMLLKDASGYLDDLAQDAHGDTALQRELATAYIKLSDLQGAPYGGSLGNLDAAIESLRKGLTIEEALLERNPNDTETRRSIVSAYTKFGNLSYNKGDARETRASYQKAENQLKLLLATEPNNKEYLQQLARLQLQIGSHVSDTELDMETGRAYQRAALETAQKILSIEPNDKASQSLAATSYARLANLLGHPDNSELGDFDGALENYHKSSEIRRHLMETDATNLNHRRQYAVNLIYQASVLLEQGKNAEAIAISTEAHQIFAELINRDKRDFFARGGVPLALTRLGEALVADKQFPEGIEKLREANRLYEQILTENKGNVSIQNTFIAHLMIFGNILAREKNYAEASAIFQRAFQIQKEVAEKSKGFQIVPMTEAALYSDYGMLKVQQAQSSVSDKEKLLAEALTNLETGVNKFNEFTSHYPLFRRFESSYSRAKAKLEELRQINQS